MENPEVRIGHLGLRISHLNIESLLPKIDLVRQEIISSNTHIATYSETWLRPTFPSAIIDLQGYTLIRQDRQGLRKVKGGGICAYIRNDFICDTTSLARLNKIKDSYQMLWLEIKPGNLKKITLGIVYKPPDGNAEEFLLDFREALEALGNITDRELHILGDFNLDITPGSTS